MFSEMILMRPAWTRSPDAAIAIDFRKSMELPYRGHVSSALAERDLDQAEAAGIERRSGLEIGLVVGDLDHLVFEADAVAGRYSFETARAIGLKAGRIAGAGNMS